MVMRVIVLKILEYIYKRFKFIYKIRKLIQYKSLNRIGTHRLFQI